MSHLQLPTHMQPYAEPATEAGKLYSVDPLLLLALCDRESECGLMLSPRVPGGTGDFRIRVAARYASSPHFRLVQLPSGTHGFLPADGKGWGRGLMQVDYGFHTAWCLLADASGPLWAQPNHNLAKGAEVFARALHVTGAVDAAVCAYNAGENAAMTALERFGPEAATPEPWASNLRRQCLDRVTTGGNYVSWVLHRFEELQSLNPPSPGVAS